MFSTYLTGTLLVIFITYLISNYIKNRRFWKLVEEFYGYRPYPIVGNAFQMGSTSEAITKNLLVLLEHAGYKTYKFTVVNDVYVNLCNPETIEAMLSHSKEITKMREYNYLKDWLGDGLLLATGNKWRTRRKIITPAFHFNILERFIKVFDKNSNILVEQLSSQMDKLFDITPFISACTLDIISEAAMGVVINAQTDGHSDYVEAVHSMCELLNRRFRSPLKRITWIYKLTNDYKIYNKNKKILHNLTLGVIHKRREVLKDQIERVRLGESLTDSNDEFIKKRKTIAFLDLLLLSKQPDGTFLSDEGVREEVDTFMFAGHDTSTSAISFTLYELSKNPEVQLKSFEEISSLLGRDWPVEVNYDDLQNMKYLEMVIKETLRLYPPVPKYGRFLENDLELPEGKIVPKGCTILIDALGLGRNPLSYPEPEKFRPERFSFEKSTGRHPYLHVPFSAGLRNCIGQKFAMLEMKMVLSKILLKYELRSGGEAANVRLSSVVTLKSENGVQLYIKERKR